MSIPRPEYPRPSFVRDSWQNLNGAWEFLFDFGNSGVERGLNLNENFSKGDIKHITVPFCPESRLSGIEYTDWMSAVWYRRSFKINTEQLKGRTLIHFGAVDYHSIVYINEKKVGEHFGGYSSFTFDITDYIKEGDNTIILYAEDDNRTGEQPFGKQSVKYHSYSCSYTRTTGIWQTVWLEFVPKAYIKQAKITPFVDDGFARIDLDVVGSGRVEAVATFENREVGRAVGTVAYGRASLTVKLSELHLWDIGRPELYDLTLTLDGGDSVKSYFGMRKVELADGVFKLNDRPVFMRLILDQGYNPEGIYTYPTEEYLKRDIEKSMALGFNGTRLHMRIFEERTLYWADKLGYIVWGESAGSSGFSDANAAGYLLPEWIESVERDYSHPCIIGWCPFNETYYQFCNATISHEILYDVTKQMDPYRPVIDASGGMHFKTDMFDVHTYIQQPEKLAKAIEGMIENPLTYTTPFDGRQRLSQRYEGQPFWVSEYGGTCWNPDDATGWGYGSAPVSEEELAQRFEGLTDALLENPGVCGFCYTQLTDVEQELNGLFKYNRDDKFSPEIYERIRNAVTKKAAIEK